MNSAVYRASTGPQQNIASDGPALISTQTKPSTKEASVQTSAESKKSATTDAQTRHPTQLPAAHWGEAGLASHIVGPPYQSDEAHQTSQMVWHHTLANHTSQMRPTAWPSYLRGTKHWMKKIRLFSISCAPSSALLYFSANSCQVGANFLQCPHLKDKN